MKKFFAILTLVTIAFSVNAQSLVPSQSTEYEFAVVFDSIQVPDYFGQQGLKPSYYMSVAHEARLISLVSSTLGAAGYLLGNKLMPNDSSMSNSMLIIGGIASVASYIVSIVYDKKAINALSNIKLTGNGVTISF